MSLSFSVAARGASAKAAARSLAGFRALVAIDIVARADRLVAPADFFVDFDLFAALRFVAMVPASSRQAR
jgi:hypothetical protein